MFFHSPSSPLEKKFSMRWTMTVLLLLISVYVVASAGGGGGGGSDHDSGGIGAILWYIIALIPFPYNMVVLGAVIVFGMIGNKKLKTRSGLNSIASFDSIQQNNFSIPPAFLQRNPTFNEQAFNAKVSTAFMGIQDAWMRQDLRGVRKWISDGVWQRFNTQFIMMQALGQKNTMSDIQIQHLFIDDIQQDGNYDIITAGIHFTMQDNFVCEKFPELNVEGGLENIEYWTFLRKTGVPEKDMYHTQNCPNCGNALPENMGEVSKCESCGSVTTLGDYDWVLSEITQAADYANENNKLEKSGKLTARIREALGNDPNFSVQLIEDKASNAYMQIMTALVLRKPEIMRRFASNELFEKISEEIKATPPYLFNRLYLNNVTLMDFYQAQGKDQMVISFRRTSQKVDISSGKLNLIDSAPFATTQIMIMSRDTGAGKPNGSLYAHSCPSCGGPLTDTLDIKCSYCGAELNSTKNEWIISQLLESAEYTAFTGAQQLPLTTHIGTGDLDPLFKVRDYAFNNVMLIIGADGNFDSQEIAFAFKLAKKLGYDSQKISGMVDLAKNNQLTLRLPENRKQAQKVFEAMQKAAMADGTIQPEEKAILDDVQARINVMPV